MQSIDDDAKMLGIDEKVWQQFKQQTSKPQQIQLEFEEIVGPIDDREAFIRRKEALAKRWFGYYRKCKDQQKKFKLIDQYNKVALMKQRD